MQDMQKEQLLAYIKIQKGILPTLPHKVFVFK